MLLNNCKCVIAPIVRYINFQVIDGNRNIFLNDFEDQINQVNMLGKLNICLAKHGFKGKVQLLDGTYFYSEN